MPYGCLRPRKPKLARLARFDGHFDRVVVTCLVDGDCFYDAGLALNDACIVEI